MSFFDRFLSKERRVDRLWKRGLVAIANGEPERALVTARELESMRWSGSFELELRALCALGRRDEALATLERGLARAPENERLWAARASVQHALRAPREDVVRSIDTALMHDKAVPEAAALLRELAGQRSSSARRWKLIVEGRWHTAVPDDLARVDGTKKEYGFFATYFVIAETSDEALELCRRFEPVPVRESMTVSAADDMGGATEEFLGVERARPGYTFYALGQAQ